MNYKTTWFRSRSALEEYCIRRMMRPGKVLTQTREGVKFYGVSERDDTITLECCEQCNTSGVQAALL